MKGKYHIIVQNRRVKFEFDIKRNITIIRGDSATGKTTLFQMIDTYMRLGDSSGISISCERTCRTIDNSNWEWVVDNAKEEILFVDEETYAIKSKEFAEKVKGSDNYFVIITRENLPNLPYSVEEVYGIRASGKYAGLEQTYNSFFRLYTTEKLSEASVSDVLITEDSNSGHEFFKAVASSGVECVSAVGKTRINKMINATENDKKILVVADGAAFGPQMSELMLLLNERSNISLYLPESFEWLILSSGIIDGNRVKKMVDHTEEYADSVDFFSWERFYTNLLTSETAGTYLQYSKRKLNDNYLNEKEKNAILDVMDVIKGFLLGD